jgi:AraC-like DNA-binding protein
MSSRELSRKLFGLLDRTRSRGLTPLPFLGAVCCLTRHRLHAVCLPQSAAVLVLEGTKTLHRGGERLSVPAGRMFLLPAQMEITVENEPAAHSGRYLALCLCLAPDLVARVAAQAGDSGPAPVGLDALAVVSDVPLLGAVNHLLDMALACPEHERLLGLCLEEVALLAAERTAGLPLLWTAAASWRGRCAALVAADPGRGWSSTEVARCLGAGERSLRRNLAAEGASLREVLQAARLNAGLALLQGGGLSVAEVADRCGYGSASRFAGRFRERFGVTPSEVLRFNIPAGAVSEPDLAGTGATASA